MKLFATFVAPLVVSLQVLFVVTPVQASMLSMGFGDEFSGGQAPGGPRPWIVSTFDDSGPLGSVRLSLTASGLVGRENISQVYFNLLPEFNPADLDFTFVAGSSTGPAALDIRTGTDKFKASNSGKYDLLFEFRKGKGFDAGETVVYDIAGIDSLSVLSFDTLSMPKGRHRGYFAAAHVQNTGGKNADDSSDTDNHRDSGDSDDSDDSGDSGDSDSGGSGSAWIAPITTTFTPDLGSGPGGITNDLPAVPIPASVWLFGSGLVGLVGFARKRKSV